MPTTSVIDQAVTTADAVPEFESWRVNIRGVEGLIGERPAGWWTGKQPIVGTCPGMDAAGKIRALPLPNLNRATRQDILDYFDNGWTITEVLFSALKSEEAFFRPPYHHLRHPMVFYYAHPAVLYINKLRVAGLIAQPIDEHAEHLFETGVDEMSWDDMSKNTMRWPAISDVTAYRSRVYQTVRQLIETHPGFDAPVTMDSPLWAVMIGLEHERIHIETSSVLMREMPTSLLQRPSQWPDDYQLAVAATKPTVGTDFVPNDFIAVPATTVMVGKEKEFPSFGWDNEYGRRNFEVAAFAANRYLVSNGEYHEFVTSGGYQEPQWWSEDGWKWRTFRNAKWPVFWVQDGPAGLHQYKLRLIFEAQPMQWSWPADVNYHEARAFASWRAHKDGCRYRLETELEHVAMRDPSDRPQHDPTATHDLAMQSSGVELAEKHGRNQALAYGSESPVQALQPNRQGFHDLFGNVWQWCEDHLAALPGFKVHRYYDDFSTPCFDGKHHVILGGSFVSIGDEASTYARFHFRPHFTQHAGFRLVRPNPTEQKVLTSCTDAPPPYVGSGPCCSLSAEKVDGYDSLVMLAAKADIREELDRLGAHTTAARDLLAKGGAVGRRLDFLAQELSREARYQSSELYARGCRDALLRAALRPDAHR